jgi:3-oxoacyl-[acyl-carrier-protein] synthase-3
LEAFDSKERFGIPYEWLERATGIRERRRASSDLKPSDMAAKAAKVALERAGVLASEIDVVIYAGMVRDHIEPATAHLVQHKIGASSAIAMDISNACLGFMSGMHVMDSLIATGQARRGLVVTGEQGFRYTEKACRILKNAAPDDRERFYDLAVGMTLGDAGAAVIMGPKIDPDRGIMGFMVRSEGQHHGLCYCGDVDTDGPLMTKISEIVTETAQMVAPMFHQLMGEHLKWEHSDLDWYIPHQVGMRTTKRHADELRLPLSIIPVTVDYLGNIISATIPVILDMLLNNNEILSGTKLYLAGSGSGISVSQAGIIWDAA